MRISTIAMVAVMTMGMSGCYSKSALKRAHQDGDDIGYLRAQSQFTEQRSRYEGMVQQLADEVRRCRTEVNRRIPPEDCLPSK